MLVRLIVDADNCIGSAECVALDPEAVELDGQDTARILVPELEEDRAVALCDVCPVGSLTIGER